MFRPPTPLVKNLLILNIGIAAAQWILKMDLGNLMGLHYIFSDEFLPFQFFTYMFLHDTSGIMHLLGNMLLLFFFGPLLEDFLGQKKFLILYLAAGLGAGIIYTGVNYIEVSAVQNAVEVYIDNPNADDFNRLIVNNVDRPSYEVQEAIDRFARDPDNPALIRNSVEWARALYNQLGNYNMVGASGAVIGVLVAFALFFPNTEVRLLFPPIAIKAKYIAAAMILFDIYGELQRAPGDTVAHWAHLGGALVAFILVTLWKKDRSSFY